MPRQINDTAQVSSDDEILLPMCNLMPANDIITKQYEPDHSPMVKLITKQHLKDKQYKNQAKQQEIVNSQFSQYAELFKQEDFLGSYYANKLHQMIYFKFNNKNYNQLKIGDKKCRFFTGFFVQKEELQQQNFIVKNNFMKNFMDIDFVDYNNNYLQSFGKNSRGNLQDPKFSSNYESANLFAVIKIKSFQYDLVLQNDMNSKGNTQWFNFLTNFSEQGTYKFNIVNFTKYHSLYKDGMKIACYSFSKQYFRNQKFQNRKIGSGWFRGGNNIKYYRSNIQRQTMNRNDSYYTLSFQYTCKSKNESIIFANSIPYSGLDMEKYFSKIMMKKVSNYLKMEKHYLCASVAGQPIHYYMISYRKFRSNSLKFKNSLNFKQAVENAQKYSNLNLTKLLQKQSLNQQGEDTPQLKSIILMSRQHPGQTQSSFVLQGMIDYLMTVGQFDQIKKNFIFFIFPMINIDGVKYGHYRTNMHGFDLNRVWRTPKKQYHPQVYYTKKLMYQINRANPISLVLDLHGHSKQLNSFFYGNPSKKQFLAFEDSKIFAFICSKRIKQVSYKQSTFHIRQDKKNSARVVLGQMFPKALIYTLQSSFYGFGQRVKNTEQLQITNQPGISEFTPQGYRRVGRQILNTYLQYTRLCSKNTSVKVKWMKQLESIYSEMQKSKQQEKNSDAGSDSEVENELIQLQAPAPKQSHNNLSNTSIIKNVQSINKTSMGFYPKNSYVVRKSEKKRAMPLPKTICSQHVGGTFSKNMKSFKSMNTIDNLVQPNLQCINENLPEESVKKFNNNIFNIPRKPEYPQAVLSIFKIQTQRGNILKQNKKPFTPMNPNSQINLVNSIPQQFQQQILKKQKSVKQNTTYESAKPQIINHHFKLTKQNNPLTTNNFYRLTKQDTKTSVGGIRKKQEKSNADIKLKFEDVMNQWTQMKGFLQTKGLSRENRKS